MPLKLSASTKSSRYRVLVRFVTVFGLALAIAVVLIGFAIVLTLGTQRKVLEENAKLGINFQVDLIHMNLLNVDSDLVVLANSFQYWFSGDRYDKLPWDAMADRFLLFCKSKRAYDQVRFLDASGMEHIRVNWNDGKPVIIPKEQLQNKGTRYYFRDTMTTPEGKIYVSPFDLNIENDAIELPYKPMLRFGVPIRDEHGTLRGAVIINYLGKVLLNRFRDAAKSMPGQMLLANTDGFWLIGPDPEDEWGFMLPARQDRNLPTQLPEVWRHLQASPSGQFYSHGKLITYDTVYPLQVQNSLYSSAPTESSELREERRKTRSWKIISIVPSDAQTLVEEFIDHSRSIWLLTAGLIAIAGFSLSIAHIGARRANLERERKVLLLALSQSPDPVCITTTDGGILYRNLQFTQTFMDNAANTEDLAALRNRIDNPDIITGLLQAIHRGEEKRGECEVPQGDGCTLYFAYSATPIRDEREQMTHCIITFKDITLRKTSEDNLRQYATELEQFNSVMVDRENRMIALKQEVNSLCKKLSEPLRYPPV